jgi:ribosomal protein L15E
MSAELNQKKKKGYTTVRLRLSTGAQARTRGTGRRTASRVRFLPERATLERLTASLQALQTSCGY